MDNNTIWFVVAVAAILSLLSKSKKKSTKAHPTSIPHEPSPWDIFKDESTYHEPEYKPMQSSLEYSSERETTDVVKVEVAVTPATDFLAAYTTKRMNPVVEVGAKSAYGTTEEINSSESTTDMINSFDLRKAVIYSEILRAKYKEY